MYAMAQLRKGCFLFSFVFRSTRYNFFARLSLKMIVFGKLSGLSRSLVKRAPLTQPTSLLSASFFSPITSTTKSSSSSFHTTTTTMGGQDEVIRVLSERTMIRGLEGPVERLMERVQTRVRKQPGLISFQALVDADEPCKFLVLTRWSSQHHLDAWLEEKDYQTAVAVSLSFPYFVFFFLFFPVSFSLERERERERERSQRHHVFFFSLYLFVLFCSDNG